MKHTITETVPDGPSQAHSRSSRWLRRTGAPAVAPSRPGRALLATVLMTALTAVAPAAAHASSTYNVEECGSLGVTGAFGFTESNSGFVGSHVGCGGGTTGLSLWPNDSATHMALGDRAGWKLKAPPGETVTGLGTLGGSYHSRDGWLSGWAINGTIAADPMPANEDCTSQSPGTACTRHSSGWIAVPKAYSVELMIRCSASSTASKSYCGNGMSYANADFATAVVQLRDPSNPALTISGSLWQAARGTGLSHGWISGIDAGSKLAMSFSADNPGGICRLEATLTDPRGTVVARSLQRSITPQTDPATGSKLSTAAPFGSTLPCGPAQSGTGSFAPDLSKLPTGVYYLNVEAQDPSQWEHGANTYATGASATGGYPIAIDNSVPTVSIATGTTAGGWSPGTTTATVTAADQSGSSGLERLTCDVAGAKKTYPLTGDHATVSIPLSANGADQLTCYATSAAGNVSSQQTATVHIDQQRPSVSFAGAPAAPSWSTAAQTVTVTAAEPTALSGIASTSCSLDGGPKTTAAGASRSIAITGDGVHHLACTATTVAGVTGAPSGYTVQIDAQHPVISYSGAAATPAWLSGTQHVQVHAAESLPLSGIARVRCRLDGGTWVTTKGDTETVAVAGNGSHTVVCDAITMSGVTGADFSETLRLDDHPPTLTLGDGPRQGSWYRTTQTIEVAAAAVGGADLSGIDCSIGGSTMRYPAAGGATSERVRISVPPPGGDLDCHALDTAGKRSADATWAFQIDDTAPTGTFLTPSKNAPARLVARASDRGSGVSRMQIQIDEASGWRDLRTAFDRRTGIATATVPDNGSLRNGTYAVRALATDAAGNAGTIATARSGVGETITLPLRKPTALTATVRAGSEHLFTASARPARRALKLRHGQMVQIAGRLTAGQRKPVGRATIVLAERVVGRSRVRRLGRTKTNADGGFLFSLRGGPSRTLLIRFPGSRRLRTSTVSSQVRVRGLVRLTVPKVVRAGHRTTIRGRVLGGYIPKGGALVQLWYSIRHRHVGWQPFEHAIRTRRNGRFRITFPVSRAARKLRYSFKAVVARQAQWPYLGTTSNRVTRRFR